MIKVLVFDLARVFLYPKNASYNGELNELYFKIRSNNDFNFDDFYFLDTEELDYLLTFKKKYPLYIFTSEVIQNDPAIKSKLDEVFSEMISALDFGFSKKDSRAYTELAKKLKVSANEIWYTDDNPANIEAARRADINAVIYESFDKLKKDLQEIKLYDKN